MIKKYAASFDRMNFNKIHKSCHKWNDQNEDGTAAEKFVSFLFQYFVPALVLFGTIGNVCLVIAFLTSKLRKIGSVCFVASICFSDTIKLLDAFLQWLSYFVVEDIYDEDKFCQAFTFLSHSAQTMSVWILVAISVERLIATLNPLRSSMNCNRWQASFFSAFIAIFSLLLNTPYIYLFAPIYSTHFGNVFCIFRDVSKVRKYYLKEN